MDGCIYEWMDSVGWITNREAFSFSFTEMLLQGHILLSYLRLYISINYEERV